MNILIVGDDGAKAHGLNILIELAKRQFRDAPTVVLSNTEPTMGRGFSITPSSPKDLLNNLKELAPNRYEVKTQHPMDLIYLAFMHTSRFFRSGGIDLVLSGVNLGPNVGWDVLHSGTVSMGICAASQFQSAVFCFSQDVTPEVKKGKTAWPSPGSREEMQFFRGTEIYLPELLNDLEMVPGQCWSVNFPSLEGEARALGYRTVPIANYSNWPDRRDPALPITSALVDDVQQLSQGYITISPIELRLNPILR